MEAPFNYITESLNITWNVNSMYINLANVYVPRGTIVGNASVYRGGQPPTNFFKSGK